MSTDDDTGDDSLDPIGDAVAAARAAAPGAPVAPYTLAQLAAAGLTDCEIAEATGLPLAQVQASPHVLVPLGPAHDARVARAIYQAAVGGERWKEQLSKFGDVERLREQLPPDPKAAAFYLERRQRGDWGEGEKPPVRVIVERGGRGRTIEHDPT